MSLPFKFPINDYAHGGYAAPVDAVAAPANEAQGKNLTGFHRESGIWVTLYDATGLDDKKTFLCLGSNTQPDISRGFIKIDDFSAFKMTHTTQTITVRGRCA